MKHILIVTSHENKFTEFINALANEGPAEIIRAGSLQEAMDALDAATPDLVIPDLVIIDEEVNGTPGLTISRDILMKNAMVNQVLVSSLTPNEFHEASEGLGIMAQLPPEPDAAQAKKMLSILKKMP
jgi:DNA-binding NarL/FixJ family response regulator